MLFALFNPLMITAIALDVKNIVTKKPTTAINVPLLKITTSAKTPLIKSITLCGANVDKPKMILLIKKVFPSQPKTAIKNNIKGKIPNAVI